MKYQDQVKATDKAPAGWNILMATMFFFATMMMISQCVKHQQPQPTFQSSK
jgi:hypothetical protein